MVTSTKVRELDIVATPGAPSHISAASGLVLVGPMLHVIADDELHIGVFPATGSDPGRLIRIFEGVLPENKAARKRRKPDLEALAFLPPSAGFRHGALLALGSGSRPNRRRGAVLELDPSGQVGSSPKEVDMSPLLEPIRDIVAEVNLEGAIIVKDELLLFQRGHKGRADNAILRYPLHQALEALRGRGASRLAPIAVHRPDLPMIRGVPFCFTDAAALPDGNMVFCAVAEDTQDAYNDGPCTGAGIGVLGNDGGLLSFESLDQPYKVEGNDVRVLYDRLEILLVTDADDPSVPAVLLRTTLEKSGFG